MAAVSNPLDDALKNINDGIIAREREAGVNLPPDTPKIGIPNYEVHNPEIQATLRSIGAKIGGALPEGNKWGFMLMIFEYGQGGANFYMSSADRRDVMNLLKEWLIKELERP